MGLFSESLTLPTTALVNHEICDAFYPPQKLCVGSFGFSPIISFILLLTAISPAMAVLRPHPRAPGIESTRHRNESCPNHHQSRAEEKKSAEVNWASNTGIGRG